MGGGNSTELELENEILKKEVKLGKRKIGELENKLNIYEPPLKKIKLDNLLQGKSILAKPPVICLTGFKTGIRIFNFEMKKRLNQIITSLGGIIYRELNINSEVTHIVTSQYSRTMKVLQGIASKKWICSIDWLLESEKQGCFVDEEQYGFKRLENPLQGAKIFLSQNFQRYHKSDDLNNCNELVSFSGGFFVSEPQDSNFIVVTNENTGGERKKFMSKFKNSFLISWNELIDIMYPLFYEKRLVTRYKPHQRRKKKKKNVVD